MIHWDFTYFLYVLPPFLLGLWAQARIRSTYAAAQQIPAPMSGAAAARYVLDSAGLQDVPVEPVEGHLTDHYDPSNKVLRLSSEVYQSRSMAAVGIAAHEAGHAIQDARHYMPLVIRNAAVPMANIGSTAGVLMLMIGLVMQFSILVWAGIALFAGVVFFQVVNLPVEFDASNRAKAELVSLGVVHPNEMVYVNKVLNAAALTYVAATLQALATLLYYLSLVSGRRD